MAIAMGGVFAVFYYATSLLIVNARPRMRLTLR
jgi:hypothetical protein